MPASFRIHHIEDILDSNPEAYKPFYLLWDPELVINRGDRIIFIDVYSKRSLVRDVANVLPTPVLPGDKARTVHLMHPEVRCLRQIAITNQHGLTSVVWVGDTPALKIGRSLRLHDSFDEWRIDGLFTAMVPHALPDVARVVHVEVID